MSAYAPAVAATVATNEIAKSLDDDTAKSTPSTPNASGA